MNEPGNHHSQQTDPRTENQTPHVLTLRQVLNNENTWTQGGSITHWVLWGGTGEGQQEVESVGRDNTGRDVRYR